MNLGGKKREPLDVNITPLIDVVFLLLIFFMVSTTFKKETSIKIDLPEASAKPVKNNKKTFELIVDSKGRYFIKNKGLVNQELKTVKQVLLKNLGKNSKRPFVIRADNNSPHGSVVRVMDAARQLGILNLSIAITQPKE
ncbi:MAG: biopolymer transporter ExbD [Gammaproteobacteria bacterium]|nr:biopolymer transporter ExbD [Gammaproteobacteria bacterium]